MYAQRHAHALHAVYAPMSAYIYVHMHIHARMQVYQSWLGYYNSHLKRLNWTREDLVRHAAMFAVHGLRMASAPVLDSRTVGMMALKGVEGLVIEAANDTPQKHGKGRGGGGRGGPGRGVGGRGRRSVAGGNPAKPLFFQDP